MTDRLKRRMTFRLREQTYNDLVAIEAKKPRELRRDPGERVRLVVENYVEKNGRKRQAAGAR